MEKKKNQNNNKTKRSVRTMGRDNKSREENGRKMPNGNETHTKAHAKLASDSVISNKNAGSESSEVYENVVIHYVDDAHRSEDTNKCPNSQSVEDKVEDLADHSSDLSGDIQQAKGDDSDFESAKDSASSQGDPQTGDDEKIESISRVVKETAKKGSLELSSRKSRAKQDNEKSKSNGKHSQSTAKKPAKFSNSKEITKEFSNDNKRMDLKVHPASESSEGTEDKSFEEVDLERSPESPNGTKTSENNDDIACAEDNCAQQQEKAALEEKLEIMESRIEKMEEELTEVAALEISLYSVIPEHGSSAHKVHTPARRLSRLYIHACKNWAPSRRATIARGTVSGLILVARSCGNDVARLTFWLSNTVVLREIISQAFGVSRQRSPTRFTRLDVNGKSIKGNAFPLNSGSTQVKEAIQLFEDWQETSTFTTALEKVEAWIFSRVVESVWWQALTPNMLTPVEDLISQKSIGRLLGPSLGNQQQGDFSIELWKNAFQAAFQRLCPVRAAGHECGCLPVLARMVMEQCYARLDVAMFNAILRESAHQIPTDPVSDPIVDSRVLPIPAGDLSFGSGAQLKNSVGNWSMWFTESLGKETSHLSEDRDSDIKDADGEQTTHAKTKCFHLLNELSELLMLPKDMLMDPSIRKEVCPSLSLAVIIRILCNFTPDEFCPDAVPSEVLEALNAESFEERKLAGDYSGGFPYAAQAVVYCPPSSQDVSEKVAEAGGKTQLERNASMVQKKGYTSDEELDDLDSPLTSIMEPASPNKSVNGSHTVNCMDRKGCRGNARYQLLREVWSS
uniref:Dilute domain-containing protein n=2 Tax=Opuntia streptacantha TaxID=393608 RepID=A0A7C9A122_OPUST